jgi:two-component system cell cycle response regulator
VSAGTPILLVEDSEPNQLLMRSLLERDGYQVEVAGTAGEALDILGHFSPALILMDIQLPGNDGLSLTRELRTRKEFALTPIVAVTAYAMAGDREQALAAGCTGYISKPIDVRLFRSQIAEYLPDKETGSGQQGKETSHG